jgi:hypothetical protein
MSGTIRASVIDIFSVASVVSATFFVSAASVISAVFAISKSAAGLHTNRVEGVLSIVGPVDLWVSIIDVINVGLLNTNGVVGFISVGRRVEAPILNTDAVEGVLGIVVVLEPGHNIWAVRGQAGGEALNVRSVEGVVSNARCEPVDLNIKIVVVVTRD